MRRFDHVQGRDFGTAPGKCAVIRPASHGVAAGSRSLAVLFVSFRSRRMVAAICSDVRISLMLNGVLCGRSSTTWRPFYIPFRNLGPDEATQLIGGDGPWRDPA
jgi:hypothetical protein